MSEVGFHIFERQMKGKENTLYSKPDVCVCRIANVCTENGRHDIRIVYVNDF
jgi:hypothetical protein